LLAGTAHPTVPLSGTGTLPPRIAKNIAGSQCEQSLCNYWRQGKDLTSKNVHYMLGEARSGPRKPRSAQGKLENEKD